MSRLALKNAERDHFPGLQSRASKALKSLVMIATHYKPNLNFLLPLRPISKD